MRRHRLVMASFVAVLAVLPTACAGSGSPVAAAPASGAPKEIIVFAAASLAEAFQEMAGAFSARNGAAKPVYNFGGSNQLRAQIEQGARADLFASANEREMDTLVQAGMISGSPQVFARNRLVVITPPANPGGIESLRDLSRDGLKLILAGPNVPVGGYALQMLDRVDSDPTYGPGFKERVLRNVISQETDVKQVVAKIQLGEGDAGIVYSSDVTAKVSREIRTLEVPGPFSVVAVYPVGVVRDGREPGLARAFVDYLLSVEGQATLRKHRFETAR